jgi:hypothetical protein
MTLTIKNRKKRIAVEITRFEVIKLIAELKIKLLRKDWKTTVIIFDKRDKK